MIFVESLLANGRWRIMVMGSGCLRCAVAFGRTRAEARERAAREAARP